MDDWSNDWTKEFFHIKIPAFESTVIPNSKFWIHAGYTSKTCLKTALVDTPNVKQHRFVLKTTAYPFDPILPFLQPTWTFWAICQSLSLHLYGKMPKSSILPKAEDIADSKYDFCANNIDSPSSPSDCRKNI